MWKERNLPGEIIAVTPYSNTKYVQIQTTEDEISVTETLNSPRGCEIEWWLSKNGFARFDFQESKISHYVIIDDDKDMLYQHKDNFVVTSDNWNHPDAIEGLGFTKLCLQKATKILNSK